MEEMDCKQVDGGKAKVFHTAVGWEGEEKRTAFQESKEKDDFKEELQAYVKHVGSSLSRFHLL